ncbi:hypothetical protein [Alkalibacterium sp. 20]|uniref:hypothetical protein n=1 Tax=Alkalibacterium sp. 20 TaxID=1798803 RepID=UPI0009002CF3|nr:hypothetical protein [Alkalibacterium sp. 20]OJF96165.1 hypothetical protein AX762_05375 [Alkalibacterium sp. 20]
MENIKLNKEKKERKAFLSYTLAAIFGFVGLLKSWVYTPLEEDMYGDVTGGINAIVGGDAFNYIINGTPDLVTML